MVAHVHCVGEMRRFLRTSPTRIAASPIRFCNCVAIAFWPGSAYTTIGRAFLLTFAHACALIEEQFMDVRIDEKGKFFTPRVPKDAMLALVRTTADEAIIGYLYVRPDKRLKDEINEDPSRFLPVTDARVYHAHTDAFIMHTSFLLVAYQHIISISPIEAITGSRPAPWMNDERAQEGME